MSEIFVGIFVGDNVGDFVGDRPDFCWRFLSATAEFFAGLFVGEFVGDVCRRVGLPLSVGKELIGLVNAGILGGELDGVGGVLRHARDQTHVLFNRSLALLSLPTVGQVAVQHWAGKCCFVAGFCRPISLQCKIYFNSLLLSRTRCTKSW